MSPESLLAKRKQGRLGPGHTWHNATKLPRYRMLGATWGWRALAGAAASAASLSAVIADCQQRSHAERDDRWLPHVFVSLAA